MKTNKFFSFVNIVTTICILIASLFVRDNTLLLCATITLCLAIFFAQLELLERTNKTQDEPQTPPQRNLQGEPIAKGTLASKGTLISICEIENMARGYLEKEHTSGMYLVVMRLTSLRRTLEMQVKMNEQNTPKK